MTKHLFRRINKQRSAFALEQFTLILGMLSCLIIYGFVRFHHSFDSFYVHAEHISRINSVEADGRSIALTEGTLRDRITANFTQTPVTHFMKTPVDLSFEHDDKVITSSNGLLVDPYFFKVFQFPNLQSHDLLQNPNGVILSRKLANKLFEGQLGVNETLELQMGPRKISLTVRAILDDLPDNSSLTFEYLITGPGMMFWNDEAPWKVFQTFMRTESEQASILDFVNATKESKDIPTYDLQPLEDIHLSEGIEFDSLEKFDPKYLMLLTTTGILIFLVTLFNFFNLFYNQITTRIREITTKKVLGSSFSSITKSLLLEIYFHLTCALILTYGLRFLLHEPLTEFLGYQQALIHQPWMFLAIVLGAGVFAFVLVWVASKQISSYDVQNGLRGKIKISKLGFNLSKLLLTGQFIITLLAITSGLFIAQQTELLRNAEVGYEYRNVVTIKRPDQIPYTTWKLFQETLGQRAAVLSTGLAVFPSIGEYNMMRLQDLSNQEQHRLHWIGVDPGFLSTMEIDLVSGRNFDPNLQSDNQALIVNQKALALFGGEGALTSEFKFRKKSFNIIGVVRDFHHQSLKEAAEPMIMTLNNPQAFRHMVVRYDGFSPAEMSDLILATATDLGMPGDLSHTFMEKEYNQKLMKEESILSKVVSTFSGIAILISALGLFSFLAFEVNQKKGNLSIMKVLGAQFKDHIKNLGWGPFITMLLAATITSPLSFYYLSKWKSQFLFQIELGAAHVLVPLVVLSLLVLLVATFFSLKIDRTNTVAYLKDE